MNSLLTARQEHFKSSPESYDAFTNTMNDIKEIYSSTSSTDSPEEKWAKARGKMEVIFEGEPDLLRQFDAFWANRKETEFYKTVYGAREQGGGVAVGETPEAISSKEVTPAQVEAMKAYFKDFFSCDCGKDGVETT
jgi:hypothetical protein